MKNIKKITKAVAGSALLVGATLTGAAGLAAAQGGSSGDLGDYPQPFVDEDGNVQSTIVMGDSAKTIDVVGGANIAGSLGNAAFMEETKSVSVSGPGGSWTATNGQTLDTSNDQLFFNDDLDEVRDTLTEDQLPMLATTEAFSGSDKQDIEQYLYVGQQQIQYDNPGDLDDEDPQVHVEVPTTTTAGSPSNYLYQLQANFEDGVEFADTSEDDNRNDDVYDEEIEMFGQTFTVSDDSFYDDNADQLVLFGSQEVTSVSTGESATLTVGGEEHTVEVVGVTGPNTAAIEIDGNLDEYDEDDEETLSGETLRIDNIIQTNEDNSQGTVQFAVGSERVTLESGSEVMLGEDEEDVDGTDVNLEYSDPDGDGDISDSSTGQIELSSIEIAFGAPDNDENYVEAGGTYENEVFEDLVFRFGGMNPDAMQEDTEGVGHVSFGTDADDTATVTYTGQGQDSESSINFLWDGSLGDGNAPSSLMSDSSDDIVVQEGVETVAEDDYVVSDAGDFDHVWEVTGVDRDSVETGSDSIDSDDEATIELTDLVSGAQVEVDLDAASSDGSFGSNDDTDYYAGTEIIDGQTYNFVLEGDDSGDDANSFDSDGEAEFVMTWDSGATEPSTGTSAGAIGSATDTGTRTTLYAASDTDTGASVAFVQDETYASGVSAGDDDGGSDSVETDVYTETVELPSTESTDSQRVDVSVDESSDGGATANDAQYTLNVDTDQDGTDDVSVSTASQDGQAVMDVRVGGAVYDFHIDDTGQATIDLSVGLDDDQDASTQGGSGSGLSTFTPSAAVFEPEDDNDNEQAYVVTPGNDGSAQDSEVEIDGDDSAGSITYPSTTSPQRTLESDDDVNTRVDVFGAYVEHDTDNQGSFDMWIPSGQSTAGAAFTSDAGELTASGASSGGSVTTQTPTGWPDAAALDSDSNIGSLKNNEHLILVGGPAVNNLVSELAQENKTWGASGYTQGQGLIQMVEDAFSQGNDALVVAGYSGEDTRAAANYLANYGDHSSQLSGQSQVEINTAQGTVVQ